MRCIWTLRRQQVEGLVMIRDGLKTQMDLTKNRLEYLKDIGKTETNEYISFTAVLKSLSYWLEEVEKALNGKLHF